MAFIDTTYFNNEINIGGVAESNSPVVGNTITSTWIPRYEKEYLIAALGYGFYKAFIAGLVPVSPAAKWTELRDGKDYVVNDITYRWNGFKNADKVSPIAYYAYSEYMTANATSSTGTGEKVNVKQNAMNASPMFKIQRAWDAMRDLNHSLWHFLDHNKDTYTEYDSNQVDWCALRGGRNIFGI